MPSISVTEKTFQVLACAANAAKDDGLMEQANELDKLARMTNLALSTASVSASVRNFTPRDNRRWEDIPTVLI